MSVALAALVRVPLHPLLGSRVAFITFFPAIVYSAWSAGLGAGLLATALSALITACYILRHTPSLLVSDPADLFSLIVFVAVGIAISLIGQAQRRSRQQAEAHARHAEENASVLLESEARKNAILDTSLDGIITINDQGCVVEWNPAAERTFGYTHAQAMGQTLSELIIPPALRGAHTRGITHYLATGEGPALYRRVEVVALRADGAEFPVEFTAIPIHLGGKTLFTAYLRDLTERERVAEQQRAFLRDVLLSVTEGRLRLCHAEADLPTPLPACSPPVTITRTGGIGYLRAVAKQTANAYGFAEERRHDLVTATGEAAMNAAIHGGGGTGRVCGDDSVIQVWVEDQGAGIDMASLPKATLQKGFSSLGTLGHGMKMMLQTVDRVWLLTGTSGTTVVLEQNRLTPAPALLRL